MSQSHPKLTALKFVVTIVATIAAIIIVAFSVLLGIIFKIMTSRPLMSLHQPKEDVYFQTYEKRIDIAVNPSSFWKNSWQWIIENADKFGLAAIGSALLTPCKHWSQVKVGKLSRVRLR